jgi:hypothetical protein
MIIETGTIVFLSLLVLAWRMPTKLMLWLFGKPAYLEIPFALLAYILHYGTFSGMMAAAAAGVLCFGFVQIGRTTVGYISDRVYYPGFITLRLNK